MKLLLVGLSAAALIAALVLTFAPRMGIRDGAAYLQDIVPYRGQTLIDYQGEYVTSQFLLSKNEENTIRYWYENKGDTDVILRLYRSGLFGDRKLVSHQIIPVGEGRDGTYTITNAIDREAVYQVTLNPATTANYLNGTLRVTQVKDSVK